MPPKFPALLALVFLAASIAPAPAAYAVSIYDVIQLSRKGYDGRVALCCLDYDGSVVLGDLNDPGQRNNFV